MANRSTTTDKGQRWLPFALAVPVALAWSTALPGPFQFDDYNVIVGYAPVHSVAAWWESLPGLRPLLKLTYAVNWTLSPAPFGFHLFNVLVHLLNGVLLCAWARRALPLAAPGALLLAALWLLHPVQTEAVTYIAGRSVSLSATFLLGGLLLLARAPRAAAAGAALLTALALLVRETAWIFPVVFLLAEWLRTGDARAAARRVAPSFAVVALAALAVLLEPHHRQMVEHSISLRGLPDQLRLQVLAHGYLAGQLLRLAPNIDPDLRLPSAWSGPLVLQAFLIAAVAIAALVAVVRRRSWQAAGVLWYLLLLLPTNSLMPRVDAANDRHLYVALAGPLWALLLAGHAACARLPAEWAARARAGVSTGLLLLLALATLVRNEDYRSELALWVRTAEQSPQKARVWNNLGMACREAGDRECASAAFARAVALDPADPKPALNLYFLRREMGKARQAAE